MAAYENHSRKRPAPVTDIFIASRGCPLTRASTVFPHFWLVTSTSIIHLNLLLLTKFGNNFVILNQMTSKVLSYWINEENDVKSAAPCRLLNREIFWMTNKGHKAIIEFGFRGIWRILQISEGVMHQGCRPKVNTKLLKHPILIEVLNRAHQNLKHSKSLPN